MSTETETHPTPGPGPVADRFASAVPVANPALIGVPSFLVGSIALALNLTDYVPQGLVGAPVAIILFATGMGQLVAMWFALRAGESAVASVFGIFGGFWLSYGVLATSLQGNHNWFGILTPPATAKTPAEAGAAVAAQVEGTIKTFLWAWLALIVVLTLVSLRLPAAFTVLFVLVDIALFFVLLSWINATAAVPDSSQQKIGGYFAFGFIAVGIYLFADAMSAATGGKNLPLGPSILK